MFFSFPHSDSLPILVLVAGAEPDIVVYIWNGYQSSFVMMAFNAVFSLRIASVRVALEGWTEIHGYGYIPLSRKGRQGKEPEINA